MFRRRFFGIPLWVILGVLAFVYRDKLKPLFDNIKAAFQKKA